MKRILFVGDRPSSRNVDPEVAFLGTLSGKRLKEWCMLYFPDYHTVSVNQVSFNAVKLVARFLYYKQPIIALGNEASRWLTKKNIEHFKLPHPSPRNRNLNDPQFIEERMNECMTWLGEKYE